jgi:hypothetical protein
MAGAKKEPTRVCAIGRAPAGLPVERALEEKLLRQRKTKESKCRPVRGIVREMWLEGVNTAASMGHVNNVAELSEPKSLL